MDTELNEKLFQYLLHLLDSKATLGPHEIVKHSKIHIAADLNAISTGGYRMAVLVHPEIYKKYFYSLGRIEDTIATTFFQFSGNVVSKIKIIPDLDKYQIVENRLVPIVTPWEEINVSQDNLLTLLKNANHSIDFQNVGNSCRTLMQKLSNIVFNPAIHTPTDNLIDVSPAKFKNRLHSYIRFELAGSSNKELRNFAMSCIETAETAIDLANKLTHDLNASNISAESCAMSGLTVVSIVKLIEKIKLTGALP